MWFLNRSDTNQAVHAVRSLNFGFKKKSVLCSKNKGVDQLRSFPNFTNFAVFTNADSWFSHEVASLASLFSQMQIVGFLMRWLIY